MKIIFDDSDVKDSLWPLSATRNAADIRVGILTIREKWELLLAGRHRGSDQVLQQETILIDASIVPGSQNDLSIDENDKVLITGERSSCKKIRYPWDVFQLNDWALRQDFERITSGRQSQKISSSNHIIAPQNIFIEAGAMVECASINASDGPVYIGKNATVMEGSMIRGPFALCEGATLKMGAKIYGATTIGPYCIAGGEIKNSVLFGYSNKAHDGYLGDSVIGEWCNFGAGTSNSNVKNTAGEVKMWSNQAKDFIKVGIKAGLVMGDYSRTAINTSFNTGTVVGVSCNIFGSGFPPKLVNHFTWGEERYQLEKALNDIDSWKKLKGKSISGQEKIILKQLYNQST